MHKSIKLLSRVAASVTALALMSAPALAQYDTTYDAGDYDFTTSYDYGNYPVTELTAEQSAAMAGVSIISSLVSLGMSLVMYVYMALVLSTIAKKLKVENPWLAWIPIGNIYLMVKCAGLEAWHTILACIVPFYVLYVLMKVFERRGFSQWLGCTMIIPFVNFIVLGYVAWGEPGKPAVAQPVAQTM